jgi:competence protein ComEA
MKSVLKSFAFLLVVLIAFNGLALAQNSEQQKSSGKVININTATQTELESLPGVGPALAKKIIDFRQKNGGFKSPNDLLAVQGIGEKKFEQLKSMIAVK